VNGAGDRPPCACPPYLFLAPLLVCLPPELDEASPCCKPFTVSPAGFPEADRARLTDVGPKVLMPSDVVPGVSEKMHAICRGH